MVASDRTHRILEIFGPNGVHSSGWKKRGGLGRPFRVRWENWMTGSPCPLQTDEHLTGKRGGKFFGIPLESVKGGEGFCGWPIGPDHARNRGRQKTRSPLSDFSTNAALFLTMVFQTGLTLFCIEGIDWNLIDGFHV